MRKSTFYWISLHLEASIQTEWEWYLSDRKLIQLLPPQRNPLPPLPHPRPKRACGIRRRRGWALHPFQLISLPALHTLHHITQRPTPPLPSPSRTSKRSTSGRGGSGRWRGWRNAPAHAQYTHDRVVQPDDQPEDGDADRNERRGMPQHFRVWRWVVRVVWDRLRVHCQNDELRVSEKG